MKCKGKYDHGWKLNTSHFILNLLPTVVTLTLNGSKLVIASSRLETVVELEEMKTHCWI